MLLYRITRDVTRAAARSGGQRKPAAQKPAPAMTGPAWLLLIVFIVAGAPLTALFKHGGTSNGVAFLEAFAVLVVVFGVLAGICSGLGGSKSSAAMQIRVAHAEQERAKRDRARAGLPAEMKAADLEAEAWKDTHPEVFGRGR